MQDYGEQTPAGADYILAFEQERGLFLRAHRQAHLDIVTIRLVIMNTQKAWRSGTSAQTAGIPGWREFLKPRCERRRRQQLAGKTLG
jgi:hypothetical protein